MADLLSDLRRYADSRGVDFDRALRGRTEPRPQAVEGRAFAVGDEVERSADGSKIRRGYVTAVDDPSFYLVRFPGVTRGVLRVPADRIRGAPPFPPIETRTGVLKSAAAAEDALVEVSTRVRRHTKAGTSPPRADVDERARLARTLADWAGTTASNVLFSLNPHITRALGGAGKPPARVREFPGRPTEPAPGRSSPPPARRPNRPGRPQRP
ncbi:hypothetical protein [Actinomadura rayongensis]|uniref:Uncharacterized protein n=1 Tax=Actinomadura rayongensis TaxID=1429076 RepID=A0A6I4W435_9ACTN|nr:hypothetical protein [Actinomadura rayongensis]MXQ64937.1 hypothetical protein [Actinomadura rayongensis]